MKKLLKIFAILFVILAIIVIGAAVSVQMMYPPEKVKKIVNKELSKVGKRIIFVKSASLSLFPVFGFSIEGVQVSNTLRRATIEEPTTLWAYLKANNLDKRYVNVTLNGKKLRDVAKEDRPLVQGAFLEITRKGFDNKQSMFKLKKLLVELEVMPLLSKKVVVKKILFDELQLFVEVDRRGSFNFDDLISKSSPKTPAKPTPKPPKHPKPTAKKTEGKSSYSFSLKSFEIRHAKIVYLNHKTHQEIVLGDINDHLTVNMDPSMTQLSTFGLFEIKKMAVRGRGIPVRKSGMYFMFRHKLAVDLKKKNLTISDLTVGLQKTALTLKGTVKGFDQPKKKLDLTLATNNIRFQDLFKEVPPAMFPQARKMSVKGTARLHVSIKGTLDAKKPKALPAIHGLFKIMGAEFKYADLPKSINHFNADISFTQDSLHVKKFKLNIGQDPISLVAKIDHFKKPVVDVALKAHVDLGGLKDAVKFPKGVSTKGEILADVTAKGKVNPKDPTAIAVKGAITLKNIVATTPKVKKPISVNGVFRFSNSEIALEKFMTKIGQSSFAMEMKIRDYLGLALPKKKTDKPTLITYTLTSPLIDVNEIMGRSSSAGSAKSSASSASTNSASSSSDDGSADEPIQIPKLPNIKFVGKIRVKKLIYGSFPISNSSIDLNYYKGKVTFGLKAGLFKGRIIEHLIADISNPKQIRVKNRFDCLKVEANDFISSFNKLPESNASMFDKLKRMDGKVYGRMNLTSFITTHGITKRQLKKNLSGKIGIKIYRGKLKNATLFEEMTSAIPAVVRKFLPSFKNIKMRRPLMTDLKIQDGKIHITKLAIPMRKLAINGYGTISLDNVMDMKMDLVLSRGLSRRILRQQRRLMRAGRGLINKFAGKYAGKIGGLMGKIKVIPTNKRGRVVPVVGSFGKLSKLLYKFVGFKGKGGLATPEGGGSGGSIASSAKKMVKKSIARAKRAVKKAIAKARARAEKAAREAKARAEKAAREARARAERKAREAKARAEKAAREAKARARAAAERRRKELERKAREAKEKAKKNLNNAFKKW